MTTPRRLLFAWFLFCIVFQPRANAVATPTNRVRKPSNRHSQQDEQSGELSSYHHRKQQETDAPPPATECGNNSISSYFLVDLIGFPRRIQDDDLQKLSSSFLQAYNQEAVVSCLNLTSAEIVRESVFDTLTGTAGTERDFSLLLQAAGECIGCDSNNRLFAMTSSRPSTRRHLGDTSTARAAADTGLGEEGRLNTIRKTQTSTACPTCELHSRSRVLARWRRNYQATSAITSVFDIQELFFTDDNTCDPSGFERFATNVVVSFNNTQDDLNLTHMATLFEESYMAVNDLNSGLCDSQFRRMTRAYAQIVTEEEATQYATLLGSNAMDGLVHVDFYVGGLCQDCTPYSTNIFDDVDGATPMSFMQRQLQDTNSSSNSSISCLCPANVAPRGPTKNEFMAEFRLALQEANTQLVYEVTEVTELDFRQCTDDIHDFNYTILLEWNILQGNSTGCVDGVDTEAIEAAVVNAYNELAETLCDPYLRILESASVLRQQTSKYSNETLILEMMVFGKCRGCDPDQVSIYAKFDDEAAPPSSMMMTRHRSMPIETMSSTVNHEHRHHRRLETCYCDVQATQERSPTEAEFLEFFAEFLASNMLLSSEASTSAQSCSASLVDCDFGSPFQTAIVVSFSEENATAVESFTESMEAAFLVGISSLYTNTRLICNPEFRVYQSVDATVNVPFQPRDFGLPIDSDDGDSDGRRRRLEHRVLQVDGITSVPSSPPSAARTVAPTFSPSSKHSEGPSSSPTFIDTDTYVLFYLTGICNGCKGRPAVVPTSVLEAPEVLDTYGELTSHCYCPIEAGQVMSPFSTESLEDAFQDELDVVGVPLNPKNVYEVDVVECEGDINDFQGDLSIDFFFNETLTQADSRMLTSLVQETYRSLTGNYCDPLRRSLTNLTLGESRFVDISSSCSQFRLQYSVSGVCQGCSMGTALLDEDLDERRELESDRAISSLSNRETKEASRWLRFEGSSLCFCDQASVASRAPTPSEFQKALLVAINAEPSLRKVCTVSVPSQNADTQEPTPSPTVKVCNVTLPDKLSSRVLVTGRIPEQLQDNQLSQNDLSLVADAIRKTYNSLVELQYTPCDLEYRLVSNVTFDAMALDVGDINSISFVVELDCQGCAPDSDLFDPSILSRSNFERVFSRNIQSSLMVDIFDTIREIDIRTCPSERSRFSRVLRMEYTQLPCMDGLNFTGTEPQLRSVEAAFVSTYNRLALSYCDPFYRTLASAEIVRFGENTDAGNLPVEIRVTGTCRGCNVDEIDVYAIPNSISSARMLLEDERAVPGSDIRRLQDLETCFCDSQPIGERAPFESEFITEYMRAVEALQLECIPSVGQCNFGTQFTTGIVVQFRSDELLDSGNITGAIEDSFQRAINELYQVDTSTCNEEFRIVESVRAILGVNVSLQENATESTRGRSLQAVTDFPTASPTSSNPPSMAPTSRFAADGLFVSALLRVTGVCNGCANDFSFSNQVLSNRRDLQRSTAGGQLNSTSNCFCPLEASRQVRPVEAERVSGRFQAALLDSEVNLTVNNLDEITVVECIDEMREYDTFFTFNFAVRPEISNREIDDLAGLIATTYNELNTAYCDPFLRSIDGLFVADLFRRRMRRRMQEDECVRLDIEFDAFGTCRGCEDFIDLFDEDNDALGLQRRELVEFLADSSSLSRGLRRGLQDLDVCFCEGQTIASRAPTFDEFSTVFQARLEALLLPNVCGFFEVDDQICDVARNGDEYDASVDVSLVVVADDFDDGAIFDMEEIFFDTFNEEVDAMLDTCDTDYTQLFFATVTSVNFEGQNGDLDFFTVTFDFFGYCQVDGPCDGEIVFDIIDYINNEFERFVDSVVAAGVDGDVFFFFETENPSFGDSGTFDPSFEDSSGTFDPSFDPSLGTFDPSFDPSSGTFDPSFDPSSGGSLGTLNPTPDSSGGGSIGDGTSGPGTVPPTSGDSTPGSSDPGTNPPTDPITDPPTDPNTDPPTDPNTDPPTDPNTDPPTNPNTDPPTDPETDPPTNPITDPPTDPETDPPTEGSTF